MDESVTNRRELNAQGGGLGLRLEPVIVDGRSDADTFAREAERLISEQGVSVILGCWTSASRRAVRPVIERHSHLLFYPVQYEGVEHLQAGQRRDVDCLRGAAVGLLSIINDILDEAKIEAGKMTIEVVEMDLRRTIDEALNLFAPAATTKGLSLTRTISPDLPAQVRGDPLRIRQTLVNLVGNAVKFTDVGTITVDARVTAQTSSHVVVRVSVADTGIGIPPDRQAAVFDSFVQGDEGTTRAYGGTGLGLAICRDLISLMGGRIGLESEPSRGSTFWFELTLARPTIAAAA